MRVVVVGATGNVGTSLVKALADDDQITSILGLARRMPTISLPKTEWATVDITIDELVPHFAGADAVVHLAWVIQPSRNEPLLRGVNVNGSRRVFDAAAEAGVPALIYASSIGAYSPGPRTRRVDEGWPTEGIGTSFYARHKAEVERVLDAFEQEHPQTRVVRLRPALIFKKEAASEIRRLFAGPFLPGFLVRQALLAVFPTAEGLVFQCVHSFDVAEAYRLAIVKDVRGPFNVAADPPIATEELAQILEARPFRVPPTAFRIGAAATWRLRLQPTPEGWVDMGFSVPLMDTTRARNELGWTPSFSSEEALKDLLEGIRTNAGFDTPPLSPTTGGPLRIREVLQGVGKRSGV